MGGALSVSEQWVDCLLDCFGIVAVIDACAFTFSLVCRMGIKAPLCVGVGLVGPSVGRNAVTFVLVGFVVYGMEPDVVDNEVGAMYAPSLSFRASPRPARWCTERPAGSGKGKAASAALAAHSILQSLMHLRCCLYPYPSDTTLVCGKGVVPTFAWSSASSPSSTPSFIQALNRVPASSSSSAS